MGVAESVEWWEPLEVLEMLDECHEELLIQLASLFITVPGWCHVPDAQSVETAKHLLEGQNEEALMAPMCPAAYRPGTLFLYEKRIRFLSIVRLR